MTEISSTGKKKVCELRHLNLRAFLPLQMLKLVDKHSPSKFLAKILALWKIEGCAVAGAFVFEEPDSSPEDVQDLVLLEEEETLRKGVKIMDMSGETIGSCSDWSFLAFEVLVKNLVSLFLRFEASSSEDSLGRSSE
jgi:hypothetical protein